MTLSRMKAKSSLPLEQNTMRGANTKRKNYAFKLKTVHFKDLLIKKKKEKRYGMLIQVFNGVKHILPKSRLSG